MSILRVALPVPLRRTFDYLHFIKVEAGCRVKVPFGSRTLIGVVVDDVTQSEIDESALKSVIEVLDEEPIFSPMSMTLCQWLGQYYHHPIGDVYQTVMPAVLRKGGSMAPKSVEYLEADKLEGAPAKLSRAKKQLALYHRIVKEAVPLSKLRDDFGPTVIKGLVAKGFASVVEKVPEESDTHWEFDDVLQTRPRPNIEQSLAISAITSQLNQFATFLLEGVTGSGKTEVYLQAIEPVLKEGKQVLILVPEIGLTPQTVFRFTQRFGLPVGVWHSGLTDNERFQVWRDAKRGALPIIIGTRSAVFISLKRPGLMIVDEEHDASFKQQDGLRYHARDYAAVRSKYENIPLVLGTATPSLETLNNALSKRYQHLILSDRAGAATATRQQIMDIRDQPMQGGLSPGLIGLMRKHLSAGGQVLTFINRRGYAPAMICHHCGEVAQCHSCDRPFTVHRGQNKLQCHHCGATARIPNQCGNCGSTELSTAGMGTEQLEQHLTTLFPEYPNLRIDSDTARGKHKLSDLLDKINSNKYPLLVGTQILSKGHHFPNVTLVVILDIDGALFSADFRAAENLAQLVTQLAGRAGRAEKPGEMWMQTHHPGHPLLQDLVNNGYGHFARYALAERKGAQLPPYSYQALLRAEANHGGLAYRFLQDASNLIARHNALLRLGPVPSIIEKRQGRYRFQLLLQSPSRVHLHNALTDTLAQIESLPSARKVRWSLDVDPMDMS